MGSSSLYAPSSPATTVFLLSGGGSAGPGTLPLDDFWSDSGPPAHPGWFVFLGAPVDTAAAPGVAGSLQTFLESGAATGFAWFGGDGGVVVRLSVQLDPLGAPCVAVDTTLPASAGTLALSFTAGTPLRALPDAAGLQGIAASYATETAPAGPGPGRVAVALTGANAGCLTFEALVGEPPAEQSEVTLMAVSIDPLRPFDPLRTYQMFTGRNFGFASAGDGWQLVALEDRAE